MSRETTTVSVSLTGICPSCGTGQYTVQSVTVVVGGLTTVNATTTCSCGATVHLAGVAQA